MPDLSRIIVGLQNNILWKKYKNLYEYFNNNILRRFIIIGVINTLFGFLLFSISILYGATTWFALIISTSFGTIFNFITTGKYVFMKLNVSQFPSFFICYIIIYFINYLLIEILFQWIGSKIFSQFILIPPIAIFSYILMNRVVFYTPIKNN
jgi:putative flippase GtrA